MKSPEQSDIPSVISLVGAHHDYKLTVGPVLAKLLGKDFEDMDSILNRRFGVKVPSWLTARQNELCWELGRQNNLVIAASYSVTFNQDNIRALRNNGRLVRLVERPSRLIECRDVDIVCGTDPNRDAAAIINRLQQPYVYDDDLLGINHNH